MGLGSGLRCARLNWWTGEGGKAAFGRVVSRSDRRLSARDGEFRGGWRGEEGVGVGVESVVVVVVELVEVVLLSSEDDGRWW